MVYDVTTKQSFKNLDYWVNELKENENSDSKCILGIVGNKCDLVQKEDINDDEAINYAKSLAIKHKIVSAKTDPYSFINFLEELVTDARENIFKKKGKIFLTSQKNVKRKCKC